MKKVVEDVSEDEDFKSGSRVSATDYVNANRGIAQYLKQYITKSLVKVVMELLPLYQQVGAIRGTQY
uniref:Uncharacterized protein n=1 Tax=Tanacetum cinerariifolium TaxID=118510 RepID=A0A699SVX5_TANCI|nr:hypothetical protein [Tanacetum cinerariifolium]